MASTLHHQGICGTYVGYCGNRKAQLEIRGDSSQSQEIYHLRFVELERNQVYLATHIKRDSRSRALSDIVLSQQDGDKQVTWPQLYSHPWDRDYLSGIGIFDNIQQGISLRRVR